MHAVRLQVKHVPCSVTALNNAATIRQLQAEGDRNSCQLQSYTMLDSYLASKMQSGSRLPCEAAHLLDLQEHAAGVAEVAAIQALADGAQVGRVRDHVVVELRVPRDRLREGPRVVR